MSKVSSKVKDTLLAILIKDYEECQFFFAASQSLRDKLAVIAQVLEQDDVDFTALRDSIGELGICISTIEKQLYDVEECYTKLVAALER